MKTNAQIAHLFFAYTQANPKKSKEQFITTPQKYPEKQNIYLYLLYLH